MTNMTHIDVLNTFIENNDGSKNELKLRLFLYKIMRNTLFLQSDIEYVSYFPVFVLSSFLRFSVQLLCELK